MDLSIVAAVGSFVVSERVLKPKATALVILGLVLIYDLKTKTQDVAALRVYRGPSLLAFTLMMFAYSLRKWRRNGVAVDELIFLPGTQLGRQIGIEGPLIETIPSMDESESGHDMYANNNRNGYASVSPVDSMEEPLPSQPFSRQTSSLGEIDESGVEELSPLYSNPEGNAVEMVSLSSSEKEEIESSTSTSSTTSKRRNSDKSASSQANNLEEGNCIEDDAFAGSNGPLHTVDAGQDSSHHSGESAETEATPSRSNRGLRARLRQWVEQHPHLAQVWTFFFNRSAGSNMAHATYAPSGPAVFGAALDMSMPVLFNFHIFILTFNHIQRPDYTGSDFYAKTLPIAFMTVLYARVVIPPGSRMRFWGTMKLTFAAPCYPVGVRDEFIGECLTSWVRILQDLVFATIYYFIVIWGTLSRRYSLSESGEILAESWYVHNAILPMVAILPLWMKYLQTLRQAYDAQKRWPYLGNAFKYLSAALVIIYGTVHPEQRRSPIWMSCFAAALIYQIFWDVVMDWKLFEVQQEISVVVAGTSASTDTLTTRPSSRVLLFLQMYFVQPIQGCYQRVRALLSGLMHLQLRERRLYKTKRFYWSILAYNVLTRFTWMCCFIPAYHLSRSKKVVLTATSDVNSYWGVFLPAAEVFRRTLWGFLYLEKETIKIMERDAKYQQVGGADGDNDDDHSDEVTINSKVFKNQVDLMPTWLGKQQEVAHNAATSRARRRRQFWRYLFLFELCIWA
eukprot:CAMPEP_0116149594 /NCGR_PEP_ID=MMETSP0329-20121206/19054_1 /TAXON_ID=697910 /ORGANISM="Pseudo-nitzschia arenysensis, Strain B593" /LENGTH=735 /DNA_ID=CAMNT_0003645965 /DNA_START=168 /DNA_END=2371 /DNA_ORIENTATION=+